MKWIFGGLAVLAGVAALIFLAGMFVPKSHEASITVTLPKSPEEVWAVIADIARTPEWFSEVSSAERLPDRDGRPTWREICGGDFEAIVVHSVEQPPVKLVRQIQPGGAFHGTWTFDLAPAPDGTRLSVTERGVVDNAFFRGMMVFSDKTKTARGYVSALASRLGVTASPSTT